MTNQFLDNEGLSETNSLTHLLDSCSVPSDDEISLVKNSRYYSEKQFIDMHSNRHGLSIMSLNCQCVNAKFDDIKLLIERVNCTNNISVICLSECWLDETHDFRNFELSGYNLFYNSNKCCGHGGLMMYIHKEFIAKPITFDVETHGWELQCIELSHKTPNGKKYTICNVYKPPNIAIDEFKLYVEEFTTLLTIIREKRRTAFVCGDFNIDLLQIHENANYNNFFEQVIGCGYIPKITLPTRIQNPGRCSLIDNIYSNMIDENDESLSGALLNDISDHKIIFTSIRHNWLKKADSLKFIEIETMDDVSIQNFIDELAKLNIYASMNKDPNYDPNYNYDIFDNLVQFAKNKHLPKKRQKYCKKKCKKSKWMTNGILNSINTKDKLYKILMQVNHEDTTLYDALHLNFKTYKNLLRQSIRLAKKNYYSNLFIRYKHDVKKTWSVIKETLNRGNHTALPQFFLHNGKILKDQCEIANSFNSYFINIGNNLAENIQSDVQYSTYLDTNANNPKFKFTQTTEEAIKVIIKKLKNKGSSGLDSISNKLLKLASHIISKPLAIIINQMLATGQFPNKLKLSKVIPIFKHGDSSLLTNYRPISLLSSVSKIFEKVIADQLTQHFTHNNLFCNEQHGFRPGYSTELAALRLADHMIYQMDNGKIPINVYIDLSKAFDTLNHGILLSKLMHYGIQNVELDCFKNYLSNRYQLTQINGEKSDLKAIETGVPQGSILGPLLFLIYINDIPNCSSIFDMIMYADDTTLYCNIDDGGLDSTVLNTELDKISSWLASNKLSLNVSKTKYMVFHNRKTVTYPQLYINNTPIERTDHFKFLGLHMNRYLNWTDHVTDISLKLSKTIGIMHRLKLIYPQHILISLYNTLFLPHLNYCLILWGLDNARVLLLQKKAMRTITNSWFRAHTDPIFKGLEILKISDLYQLNVLKFYHKLSNGMLPSYFDTFMPKKSQGSTIYPIRNPQNQLPKLSHEYARKTLRCELISITNSINNAQVYSGILPKVQTHSIKGFALYIKNIFLGLYEIDCSIPNCYTCTTYRSLVA